jgi:hypothetical protein
MCHPNGLARSNDPVCNTGDGSIAGGRGVLHVEVDAKRQKKATLGRRGDLRFEFNDLHWSP